MRSLLHRPSDTPPGFQLHPPTTGFAAHYVTKIATCRARDAKRKGKVERPFRQLQETLLPELDAEGPPATLGELNARAAAWLDARVHAVASRATGTPPAERLEVERSFLAPLPRARFDTDYVEARRVHSAFPFVAVDGVRYSVPPRLLGQLVEVRRAVDAEEFVIRWAGEVIATHRPTSGSPGGAPVEVWDPAHHQAAADEALGRRQRHLHAVPPATPAPAKTPGRLELGAGDFDVEAPDLARYNTDQQEAGA